MIKLIIGPMFSGKSSEMIRLLARAKIAGKDVILVRPEIDQRGFLTHDKKITDIEEIFVSQLEYHNLKDYDVIGIDEGQFFSDNFSHNVNKLANEGKEVIIAGLNGTSEKKQFENIQNLIPHAEEIIKLNAICTECGSDYGAYSFYKDGNKSDDVKIGDTNEYTALCRECYKKELTK